MKDITLIREEAMRLKRQKEKNMKDITIITLPPLIITPAPSPRPRIGRR